MLYAKVNQEGIIIDVATSHTDDFNVLVAPDNPIVAAILEKKFKTTEANTKEILDNSDSEMMRVLEDLIDLLTEKRIIQFTELPDVAQKKLLSRKWIRGIHKSNDESLILEGDNAIVFNDEDSLI